MAHCEICLESESRYRCPKCGTRTCSLDCVKRHKEQGECDGVVDTTNFIKREDFKDDASLVQRDYNFLMGLDRNINVAKTDIRAKNKRILQPQYNQRNNNNHKRRQTAPVAEEENVLIRRGVKVKVLPRGMERSNMNKSSWDKRKNTFVWTLEFLVINHETGQEEGKFISFRVPESTPIKEILHPKVKDIIGETDWFCFLRTVMTKATDMRFIPLDKDSLLADALRDNTVIEFPTIIVSKSNKVKGYRIPDSDSDSESDSDSKSESSDSDSDSESGSSEEENDGEPEEESSRPVPVKDSHEDSVLTISKEKDPSDVLLPIAVDSGVNRDET